MPAKVAVPLPLSTKVTPLGSTPALVSVGVGEPVVVTMNDPAEPTVKAVALALVIVGAVCGTLTVRVKFWVASGDTPFPAVMVSG